MARPLPQPVGQSPLQRHHAAEQNKLQNENTQSPMDTVDHQSLMVLTGDAYTTLQNTEEERPDFNIKIVCVGDGGCGKTSLCLTYTVGKFPTTYVPTVFENYLANVRFNGKVVELALWDTAGQEEYDRLRVLSYPEVNILLICFSIDSPSSLENVVEKWLPEISHFCPGVPFMLVGLKTDLRPESAPPKNQQFITPQQGQAVAQKIGARSYLECSARLSRGVSDIFRKAMQIVIDPDESLENENKVTKPGNKKKAIKIQSQPEQQKKRKKKCIVL